MEDLLEEIVGEIRDEYDSAEEEELMLLNDHEARVDAGFPLEELNSRLGLAIEESGDYDSVGGYVHAMLGKIAVAGDSFRAGRALWTVEKVKGRRIESIRLTADNPWPTDEYNSNMPHTDGVTKPSRNAFLVLMLVSRIGDPPEFLRLSIVRSFRPTSHTETSRPPAHQAPTGRSSGQCRTDVAPVGLSTAIRASPNTRRGDG